MSDELKPCAHCGHTGETEEWKHADWSEWRVVCERCLIGTDWYPAPKFAIAAWNTRADDNAIASGTSVITRETSVIGRRVESGEADSRERLEADARALQARIWEAGANSDGISLSHILELLDRQARITEREIYKREQFHEKTQDMVEQIETQGIEIDGLIAERDGLRRELETQEHLAGQASRDYLRVLDRADELQEQVDSLTAERDELRNIIAHMPKTEQECEACQQAHDRLMYNAKAHQDELRDECAELQEAMNRAAGNLAKKDAELRVMTTANNSLRDKLTEKQHVCDVQRDSFLKLETENAKLRKELSECSR